MNKHSAFFMESTTYTSPHFCWAAEELTHTKSTSIQNTGWLFISEIYLRLVSNWIADYKSWLIVLLITVLIESKDIPKQSHNSFRVQKQ